MMLSHKITHYTDDDDAAETGVFYDTLISCIDEITHIANANGNGIELESDERLKNITIAQCCQKSIIHQCLENYEPFINIFYRSFIGHVWHLHGKIFFFKFTIHIFKAS